MASAAVGIVGAGMAGIAAGRELAARGFAVTLLDKGRAPGGRVATRRAITTVGEVRFDHGAQYIRAEDPAFAEALAAAGARAWPDPARVVGVPGMSALPRALAEGFAPAITIRCGVEVAAVRREAAGWFADGHGPFGALVVTAPAEQARRLLPEGFGAPLAAIRYAPCWTAMALLPARLPLPDTLRPAGHAIGWAARDSAKPGRDGTREAWVIQAAPAFSREHLERPPEEVAPLLLAALADLAGAATPVPLHLAAHRWRFSLLERALGEPFLWDPALRLGYASDGCLGGRVEAAWLSGAALGAAIARAAAA